MPANKAFAEPPNCSWINQDRAATGLSPDIVSDNLLRYFDIIVMGVGCALVSFVGLITNTLNVIVFIRQGLKDSVTISLLSLSASDLGADIFTLFIGLYFLAKQGGFLVDEVDWSAVMYVCFGWQRAACLDISALATVFISVERCLSVIMPLRIRGMFTPSRATNALMMIYIFVISCYFPVFATQGLAWQRSNINNLTLFSFSFGSCRSRIGAVSNIITGISLPTVSYIIVIVCTYLMIRALVSSSEFRNQAISGRHRPIDQRQESHSQTPKSNTDDASKNYAGEGDNDGNQDGRAASENKSKLSAKELRVVKLVTIVACVFIACTLPQVLMVYGRRFISDLNVGARYGNLHWTLFAFVYFIGSISASINMFIYLNASSRYRTVFIQTFCRGAMDTDHSYARNGT